MSESLIFGNSDRASVAQLWINGGEFTISTNLNPLATSSNSSQGWWHKEFGHFEGNDSILVSSGITGFEFRNFFIFDASGLVGPIESATLMISCIACTSQGDFPLYYQIWDVFTDPSLLLAGSWGNEEIYNDLGAGVSYGATRVVQNPTSLTLRLNSSGLAALNASVSNGYFAIGGTISPGPVDVPEPFYSDVEAMGLLLFGLALIRRYT